MELLQTEPRFALQGYKRRQTPVFPGPTDSQYRYLRPGTSPVTVVLREFHDQDLSDIVRLRRKDPWDPFWVWGHLTELSVTFFLTL